MKRRAFLLLGVAGVAHAQLPPNIQEIRKQALDEAIRKVVGEAQMRPGRVKIDVPPLIDNGTSVPLAVEVESPMTQADHVKAVHIFTERNPQPYVLTVHLGPRFELTGGLRFRELAEADVDDADLHARTGLARRDPLVGA